MEQKLKSGRIPFSHLITLSWYLLHLQKFHRTFLRGYLTAKTRGTVVTLGRIYSFPAIFADIYKIPGHKIELFIHAFAAENLHLDPFLESNLFEVVRDSSPEILEIVLI